MEKRNNRKRFPKYRVAIISTIIVLFLAAITFISINLNVINTNKFKDEIKQLYDTITLVQPKIDSIYSSMDSIK